MNVASVWAPHPGGWNVSSVTDWSGSSAALAFPASAQTPSGEISGTVLDASGSVLPGVRVTLTNAATNAIRLTQTNESGVYVFPAVPPGNYTLKVELEGFSTAQQTNINVQVGSANRFPFTLAIGQLTDVVSVVADTPVIQTQNASIGTVIENRSIVELPLNGRNYLQLASLIPGATTNGPASAQGQQRMGGQRNSFSLNVAGQRIHFNHYSLDGIENTDLNFNSYMLLPSVDALEEFKVESGIFGAEFGRAVAQINASTKSGTNAFHGSVFEFVRNAKMDAKNFFDPQDKPIPPFTRNQYGTTLGGPVISNKLFFMFNWEGLREKKSLTINASLPLTRLAHRRFFEPARQRRQPDRHLRSGDGACSTRPETSSRAPTPFPGQQDSGQPDPPGLAEAGRLLPDSRAGADRRQLRQQRSAQSQLGPVHLSPRLQPERDDELVLPPQHFPRARLRSVRHPQHGEQHRHRREPDGARQHADDRHEQTERSPHRIRELEERAHLAARQCRERGGRARHQYHDDNPLYWGVPNIGVTGLSGLGEESDAPFINDDKTIQFVDNFSWILGNHSLKFGGEIRRVLYDQIGGVVTRGRFNFDGRYTRQPLLPAAQRGGAPFADFLLGHFNNAESQVGAPIADFRSNYYALYIQDNWKVTPNLTLDYGLRWEYDQPFTDTDDKIVNIDYVWDNSRAPVFVRAGTGDPYEGNPPFKLASNIPYVRDGRFGRGAYKPDYNDIAPRLGLAWSVESENRCSSRQRHLLRARHRQRGVRHRAQRAVHHPQQRAGRNLPAEPQLRAAVRAHGIADVHPRGRIRHAVVLRRAVVARIPAGAARLDFGRSDVLRIGGRASSPPADLQQHRAERAGRHEPLPPVSRFWAACR